MCLVRPQRHWKYGYLPDLQWSKLRYVNKCMYVCINVCIQQNSQNRTDLNKCPTLHKMAAVCINTPVAQPSLNLSTASVINSYIKKERATWQNGMHLENKASYQ